MRNLETGMWNPEQNKGPFSHNLDGLLESRCRGRRSSFYGRVIRLHRRRQSNPSLCVRPASPWVTPTVEPEFRNWKQTRWRVPGSTCLRRVVFGVAPKTSSDKFFPSGNSRKCVGREFGRDARTCTRDARAPHSCFGFRVESRSARHSHQQW